MSESDFDSFGKNTQTHEQTMDIQIMLNDGFPGSLDFRGTMMVLMWEGRRVCASCNVDNCVLLSQYELGSRRNNVSAT